MGNSDTERAIGESSMRPLGSQEIARMFDVQPETVYRWQQRGILPPHAPGITVHGRPVWDLRTITKWAVDTGRTPTNYPYPE